MTKERLTVPKVRNQVEFAERDGVMVDALLLRVLEGRVVTTRDEKSDEMDCVGPDGSVEHRRTVRVEVVHRIVVLKEAFQDFARRVEEDGDGARLAVVTEKEGASIQEHSRHGVACLDRNVDLAMNGEH